MLRITRELSFAVLAFAFALGCDGPTPSTDAGSDAATRDAGLADVGAEDSGADSGTDAAADEDAAGAAMVAISGFSAFGNCMPIVAPDPIRASWTATVTGGSGASAMLTSATLVIMGSPPIVQSLTVDMPTIALTDGGGSATQTKVSATMNPAMACGATCGSDARIDLTFMIAGREVMASADGTYECAF
jgi:hypothetical protein